jgi:hypothetical protein
MYIYIYILSEPRCITHGVRQGSILGPLFFHLYVNKISTICKDCSIDSYVDDSKLFQGRLEWHFLAKF